MKLSNIIALLGACKAVQLVFSGTEDKLNVRVIPVLKAGEESPIGAGLVFTGSAAELEAEIDAALEVKIVPAVLTLGQQVDAAVALLQDATSKTAEKTATALAGKPAARQAPATEATAPLAGTSGSPATGDSDLEFDLFGGDSEEG